MTSQLLAFMWTSLIIELTPGPNMTYLALLSLSKGRKAGFAAVAGIALGLCLIGTLSLLGLGAIVSQTPALYETIRWAGFAYLGWLAYEIWRGTPETATQAADLDDVTTRSAFRDGLVTNLLNPKAALFFIAILPLFVPSTGSRVTQSFALTIIYVAIATAIHVVIVMVAAQARPFITRAMGMRRLQQVLAALLLAVAVWMLWATRR
jgi:threonine/homoserine/homoserine lactone efflux protein